MDISSKKWIELFLFSLILIWSIGILWEVIVQQFPQLLIALPFLKYNYSIVCHAEPEKLFHIGNFKTLVCSRCTGIYFGSLFSAFLILIGKYINISTKVLLLSSIPMFLDVLLHSLGLYTYSHNLSLFTGLLLGSVGFIYIQDALIKILLEMKKELN
ncbi:MAG: DUF2085 domain-containing protein [Ignavibacteriae bacterium]|nr:DUF2085 domain-containing protein [Ignavibacteriota bacterium]